MADENADLGLFGDEGTDAPPARPRKKRTWLAALLTVLLALLLVAGVAVGYYALKANQGIAEIPRETLLPSGERPSEIARPTEQGAAKPQAWVLMGSDSRGKDQGRSDTLMIAYLPGDRKHVYLVSVPRDLWVAIPGHGEAKVNAAYSFGGVPLVVQTLEQMLGVRMDHTALIDFNGYVGLTEALGGVEVVNKHAGSWNGFDFPKGTITIKGKQALAYVQERYDLPNGDLDRNERQRAVTKAIIQKAMGAGVLTNPTKFAEISAQLKTFLTFDESLTDAELRNTAFGMKITSAADVVSLSAPVGAPGTSADGQWIWTYDAAAMGQLADAMRNDTMAEYAAAHATDAPAVNPTPKPSTTK